MKISLKTRLSICFIGVLLVLSFHHFVSNKIEFATYSRNEQTNKIIIRIQDYAFNIILTKGFWFEGFGNIYKPIFQQKLLTTYIGTKINFAFMPFTITPVGLIVFLPFAFISYYSMALSYTLWITFSFLILFSAFWRIIKNFYSINNLPLLPIILTIVTIFSEIMYHAVIVGRNSIYAAGLLIHLFFIVHQTFKELNPRSWFFAMMIIWLLGIIPVYTILGLGLLLIYGMWKEAFYSILIILLFLIVITPYLTLEWVSSYLNILHMFSINNLPKVYALELVPDSMNIFRSAFKKIIGDNLANLISTVIIFCSYIGAIGYSVLAKTGKNITRPISLTFITKEQAFILFVASYLLFAPYANAYEDVLFLPVFFTVLIFGKTPELTNYKSLVSISLLYILVNRHFHFNNPLWLFWFLKFATLSFMVYFCRSSSAKLIKCE